MLKEGHGDQGSSSSAPAVPGCGGDGTCTATVQYQRALLAQIDGKDSRDPKETHRGEVGGGGAPEDACRSQWCRRRRAQRGEGTLSKKKDKGRSG